MGNTPFVAGDRLGALPSCIKPELQLVKEFPILFSGPMVRAILEGRKTQTRRIFKVPSWSETDYMPPQLYPSLKGLHMVEDESRCLAPVKCPYGESGDRLWVREGTVVHTSIREQLCGYRADGCSATERFEKNMPSIHMRRAHCRIMLEITDVRVQRLQDITKEDAEAEGAEGGCENCGETPCHVGCVGHIPNFRDGFAHIWMKINGEASWHANPWVWAVTFKRAEA